MQITDKSMMEIIIEAASELPPVPQILPKLQAKLRDVNSEVGDIVNLLKMDAQLTATIVRISNSAAYVAATKNQNLEDAINCLGFREVYSAVATAISRQMLDKEMPAYRLGPGELMCQSLACAVLMKQFAILNLDENPDSAYTIGLLHGLGKVIINQHFIKCGFQVYTSDKDEELFPDLERELLGFDNTQAGAQLLKTWNFPEESTEPIEFMLKPLEAPEHDRMACQLNIAAKLCLALVDKIDTTKLTFDSPDIMEKAGINLEQLREAAADAKVELEKLLQSIK